MSGCNRCLVIEVTNDAACTKRSLCAFSSILTHPYIVLIFLYRIILNLLNLLFLGYLRESTNSLLWTELVYSASDLLKFINDRAYDQAFRTANAIQKEKIGEVICFFISEFQLDFFQ